MWKDEKDLRPKYLLIKYYLTTMINVNHTYLLLGHKKLKVTKMGKKMEKVR